MEAKDRLWRWLVALPLFTGTIAYFNYALRHCGNLEFIELAGASTMAAMWISWLVYGLYADKNMWEDWESQIR